MTVEIARVNFDHAYFWGLILDPPPALLWAVAITTAVTLVSMILGILLGGALALAGFSRFLALRLANWAYLGFFRGTPILVQLFLIYFGLPYLLGFDLFPSTIHAWHLSVSGAIVAGIVAFSLHEAAAISEITRAGVESIDSGQFEAAKALGMTPALSARRIIMPQAIRIILPPLGNQCNAMFKTTAFLSVIAVPELVHVADSLTSVNFRTFESYLAISVYYLALTAIWTLVQSRIERLANRGFASADRRGDGPLGLRASELELGA